MMELFYLLVCLLCLQNKVLGQGDPESCNIKDCLQCLDDSKCSRCKDMVVEDVGDCVSTCPYKESLQFHGNFIGRVCTYPEEDDNLSVAYLAIIGGITMGIVIALIVGLACFFHQKRTHGNFDFLYGKPSKQQENKQEGINIVNQKYERNTGTYRNGSASEVPVRVNSRKAANLGKVDKVEFIRQVTELKPHAHVFLKMLNDVRKKYRSVKHGSPRATTYKAVIRDLSRVLFILNKKDSQLKVPPDGNQLLKWAASTLKNYENCQSASKSETDGKKDEKKQGETPGSVWIESKDDTNPLYNELEYKESELI
uniref:Uncharacterized protein LOC100368931 n=1 Tax=Saccoglossus kowalevskii TaxID=10224 RepID=A0ABM0M3R3_SACKO|nr:PREDICTED: uncharacterized protein LOC100368931 [Saccoglossus kowalevskii]